MTVAAEFDRQMALQWPSIGRISWKEKGALDALVRCVIEVETFTFGRVLQKIEGHVKVVDDAMLTALFRKEQSSVDKNWPSVAKSARDYIGVQIDKCANYELVMAYVEVRNSVVHGNGRLTRRQINDATLPKRLAAVNITVSNGHLVVQESQVRNCAKTCRDFVTDVDKATWRAIQA